MSTDSIFTIRGTEWVSPGSCTASSGGWRGSRRSCPVPIALVGAQGQDLVVLLLSVAAKSGSSARYASYTRSNRMDIVALGPGRAVPRPSDPRRSSPCPWCRRRADHVADVGLDHVADVDVAADTHLIRLAHQLRVGRENSMAGRRRAGSAAAERCMPLASGSTRLSACDCLCPAACRPGYPRTACPPRRSARRL